MKFTRKNYLELFRDGQAVVASGRNSNRHTSLVEAGEHAEQHAIEIGSPGEYEVRVNGGLYYVVKITNLVCDASLDPGSPPEAQAEFSLDATAYSGNENTNIQFNILRTIRTDQVCDVDWAVTNASVIPVSGTQRFQLGETTQGITVAAQPVDTNELGDVTLSNPVLISGPVSNPILGSPFTATFRVFDLDQPQDSFPRLAIMQIGGWGGTGVDSKPGGFDGRMARIAKHDLAVISPWRAWVSTGVTDPAPKKNTSTICPYIKTFNPNLIIYIYTVPTDASQGRLDNIEPWIFWGDTKADQERWWLYDGTGFIFPDDVKQAGGVFPDFQTNLSDGTTLDAAGLYAGEWLARANHANSGDAGDWATDGFGFRLEYGYDGVYQDIMRYEPRTSGDWDNDGTSDARDSVKGLAGKFNGDSRYHAEWSLLEPTFLHSGNYTKNPATLADYAQSIASGYQNFVNGVFMEALMGRTSSFESFAGWDGMMRYYKRAMTLNAAMDPQHTLFDNWETTGFSENDPNVWDVTHTLAGWGRYGLCSCLQDNGYYGYPTSGGYVDCNVLNEYDFDLGQPLTAPKYDGADPLISTSGSGYVADQLGVYWREYDNGLAAVNPKDNGDQTITLPSPGAGNQWDHLGAADFTEAVQDPDINDGAENVTTLTIKEREGQVIKRVKSWPINGWAMQGGYQIGDSPGQMTDEPKRTYNGEKDLHIYQSRHQSQVVAELARLQDYGANFPHCKLTPYVIPGEYSKTQNFSFTTHTRELINDPINGNLDWDLFNTTPVKVEADFNPTSLWKANESSVTPNNSLGESYPEAYHKMLHGFYQDGRIDFMHGMYHDVCPPVPQKVKINNGASGSNFDYEKDGSSTARTGDDANLPAGGGTLFRLGIQRFRDSYTALFGSERAYLENVTRYGFDYRNGNMTKFPLTDSEWFQSRDGGPFEGAESVLNLKATGTGYTNDGSGNPTPKEWFHRIALIKSSMKPDNLHPWGRAVLLTEVHLNDRVPETIDFDAHRLVGGMSALNGDMLGANRSKNVPSQPLDEFVFDWGDPINSNHPVDAMGVLNLTDATFVLRAADFTSGGANFHWIEFANVLWVVRTDWFSQGAGDNYGTGSTVNCELPDPGSGKKWIHPDLSAYTHPRSGLSTRNQAPTLNDGSDVLGGGSFGQIALLPAYTNMLRRVSV